jgi:RNA polymerase sigma factor (sigma-70 family)
MHDGLLRQILRSLRRAAVQDGQAELSDTELLRRFVQHRDPAALEVIVYRHAALVLAVCRRVLRRAADVDDAFQATFLVFLERAGAIRDGRTLASWLYRVAYRTALRAQRSTARRSAHERKVPAPPTTALPRDNMVAELQPALDEELCRLPEKYRAPLVLHFLEGLSKEETARALRCPVGTVSSRLHRGQEHLRRRLVRRGVTLTGAGLGVLLSREDVIAETVSDRIRSLLPAALAVAAGDWQSAGVPAAVSALARSVVRQMLLTRLAGVAAIVLVVGVVAGAAVAVASGSLSDNPSQSIPAIELALAQADQNKQAFQVEATATIPAVPFPNSPGYVWAVAPQDARRPEFSNKRDVAGKVETTADGTFCVTVSHPPRYSRAGRPYYRPVVFDADGERYLLSLMEGSVKKDIAFSRYRLPTAVLKADRVKSVGVEELPLEGRKTAAEHAARLARARGLEPLPLPELGQTYDFALTADDDRWVSSRSFRGKVFVLHCWARWHQPSLEQREQLRELYRSRHKDGLEVIGIDLNNAGDKGQARYWLSSPGRGWHVLDDTALPAKTAPVDWPNVRVPRDLADRELWEQTCEVFALPRVLLLDRRGVLCYDTPADLERVIAGLLREP